MDVESLSPHARIEMEPSESWGTNHKSVSFIISSKRLCAKLPIRSLLLALIGLLGVTVLAKSKYANASSVAGGRCRRMLSRLLVLFILKTL